MFKLAHDHNEKTKPINETVVKALQDEMDKDPMVVALEADLGDASGFSKIRASHPQQFVEVGIAEANMAGVAAGMSLLGYRPFMHTFSPFATRRCYDQIYLSGAYAHALINIYGSDPGFCAATNGGTHTTFEDVGLMRLIPNSIVVDACDDTQADWTVREFLKLTEGIHYLRANRKAVRKIYEEGSTFLLGKGNIIKEGQDLLIVAAGQLLADVLDATEVLEEKGISVEVIDMFTIKPLDYELLLQEIPGKKAILTIENASIYGGLGSEVNRVVAEKGLGIKVKNIGLEEQFGQVGPVDYLKKAYHLTKEDFIEKAEELLKGE